LPEIAFLLISYYNKDKSTIFSNSNPFISAVGTIFTVLTHAGLFGIPVLLTSPFWIISSLVVPEKLGNLQCSDILCIVIGGIGQIIKIYAFYI